MIPFLFAAAMLLSSVTAQAPNALGANNPNLRTASFNASIFLVPIPDATATALALPYSLLPVPTSDESRYPNDFPSGHHPFFVDVGYMNDIRMGPLASSCLLGSSIYLPFVDRLSDGKTAFSMPIRNYIGGCNGQDIMAYVPSLVGSLGGTLIGPSANMPADAAYQGLGNGQYSNAVKLNVVDNKVSGPGVQPAAIDLQFASAGSAPNYTAKTFHDVLNQPIILNSGLCQRNNYYFNYSYTEGILRTGLVTLYPDTDGSTIGGGYMNAGGYSATSQIVGYDAQSCADAGVQNDPNASD